LSLSKVGEENMKNLDVDYEEILNNLNIGYYRGELQGRLIKHNKALNKILGYDFSESLIGTKASDFLLNEEEKLKYYNELLEKGFVQNLPIHIKDKKDKILVLQINSHIVRDDRGVPLFIEGTFVDITEKVEMEQELKESEEKFKSMTEQSIIGIAIIQDDFLKYINEQLIKLTGYSMEEIKNWKQRDFLKVIHPEDRDFVLKQVIKKQIRKNDVVDQYEIRLIKKNGDIMWVYNYSKTINHIGRPANLAVLRDITKHKEAEQKLKDSGKRFREFLTVDSEKSLRHYYNDPNMMMSLHRDMLNIIQEMSKKLYSEGIYEEFKRDLEKKNEPLYLVLKSLIKAKTREIREGWE